MKHLHTLTFDSCGIKSIEPVAVRNVPNLQNIKILNGSLSYVSAGVFLLAQKLETLNLSYNKLKRIEVGSFGSMCNLKELSCDHNNLRDWPQQWFANSTNLQIINFQFNKIKILPRRAFFELQKLKEIYFNYNELKVIQPETFKGITHLKYLGLRYNRLKSIDSRIFPNAIKIIFITVAANYLNAITEKALNKIRVDEMTVDGNPWKCSCLDQVLLWLNNMCATVQRSNNCIRGDVPVCSTPDPHSNICTEGVDEEVTILYLEGLRTLYPPPLSP